jgi:transcription elongation factor S-II
MRTAAARRDLQLLELPEDPEWRMEVDPLRLSIRTRLSELLMRALETEKARTDGPGPLKKAYEPVALANAIECAMFRHFPPIARSLPVSELSKLPPTGDYRLFYRNLKAALINPGNAELRQNVLGNETTADELVTFTVEQLESPEQREQRKVSADFYRRAANPTSGDENYTMSDEFFCTSCKKRNCGYYQKQTRSADEPMTAFVKCFTCGKNWREA